MKQITLNIPDSKYAFFMELIKSLGFVKTDTDDIPQEHKEIVRERINTANPDQMMPWSKAREQFTFKS